MFRHLAEEANVTRTENGAITPLTTQSECLDLFATIGALRRAKNGEIVKRFVRAFSENRDVAMKVLFFARDVREGLGERRVFRTILRWLAQNEPVTLCKNLPYVAEYGRYDDLMALMGTPCERDMLEFVSVKFKEDMQALSQGEAVSLLAKWLPSVNASSTITVQNAKKIARFLGMTDASYRKALVALRASIHILENDLRVKDYSFDYSKQPSKAMFKYRAAFWRNDGERYEAFLEQVRGGKATLHTATLAPYEIVEPYFNGYVLRKLTQKEQMTLNTTWASLPTYDTEENALVVVDGSGSMYCQHSPMPASVALSLGLYFAEHNTGAFGNSFITFSSRPRLVQLKGETFVEKLRYASSFNEVADTNLEAVFKLILKVAEKYGVPQNEMPSKIIIVSDMEFNGCVQNAGMSNFQNAKAMFEAAGYKLPDVVFWNVASRHTAQPVTKNEQGVALVSGCTPRLFSMIASGTMNPYVFMMEVVESERYANIVA